MSLPPAVPPYVAVRDIDDALLRFQLVHISGIRPHRRRRPATTEDGADTSSEAADDSLSSKSSCAAGLFSAAFQVVHGGIPVTPPVQVTADPAPLGRAAVLPTASARAEAPPLVRFDTVVTLPLLLRDVPLDAQIRCTVTCSEPVGVGHHHSPTDPLAVALFHPFTASGELKSGSRTYVLRPPVGPSSSEESLWGGVDEEEDPMPVWECLEQALHRGEMEAVPWLDRITQKHLTALRKDSLRREASTSERATLQIAFPVPSRRLPLRFTTTLGSSNTAVPPTSPKSGARSCDVFPDGSRPWREPNLCEVSAGLLAKSVLWMHDAGATPGLRERRRLQELARRPPIQLDPLRVEDVALLWQYRHFLGRSTTLFIPFMQTVVDWQGAEGRMAVELMHRWKTLGLAEVLGCLSAQFAGIAPIRRYAVQLLDRETNERLCRMAVPLLQAVRFDSDGLELAQLLLRRSMQHWELCAALYWGAMVEGEPTASTTDASQASSTTRLTAFYQRFSQALTEAHSPFMRRLQKQLELHACLRSLHETLTSIPADRTNRISLGVKLLNQKACGFAAVFLAEGPAAAPGSPRSSGDVPLLVSALRRDGASRHRRSDSAPASPLSFRRPEEDLDAAGAVPLLTHPTVAVDGVRAESFFIYKSAAQPLQLSFSLRPPSPPSKTAAFVPLVMKGVGQADDASAAPPTSMELPLLFKCNEDLRQDQLVMTLVDWMDALLRHEGLDLCLTPYRVLATGRSDGLVEVAPDVVTLQSLQRDVLKYLRRYNPTSDRLRRALDRYTRSFAGYCVVTFVLGVGDRHLENILLARDGRLIHVDFGYILCHDPKPFPPPMKISREMVEALGGPESPGYAEFKGYCCSAYNILRNNAAFLLYYLQLMCHAAGLPQLTGKGQVGPNPDPRVNIIKAQEKLRLDLSNAQATQYLQNVVADSVGSLFTGLWDVLHAAAQATRV